MAFYKYNNEYYVDQIIYRTGLKTRDLADLMSTLGISKNKYIYCDSSDPKTRDELREYGYQVVSATRGADSIKFGIDILQSVNFFITKSSLETIVELRNYIWQTDKKTGKKLNKPIDAFNHALDAMRYFAMMAITKRMANRAGGVTYEH